MGTKKGIHTWFSSYNNKQREEILTVMHVVRRHLFVAYPYECPDRQEAINHLEELLTILENEHEILKGPDVKQ